MRKRRTFGLKFPGRIVGSLWATKEGNVMSHRLMPMAGLAALAGWAIPFSAQSQPITISGTQVVGMVQRAELDDQWQRVGDLAVLGVNISRAWNRQRPVEHCGIRVSTKRSLRNHRQIEERRHALDDVSLRVEFSNLFCQPRYYQFRSRQPKPTVAADKWSHLL
jgi:hypothetical protein